MGVPAFFRWLSRKYPSIIVHCVEEKGKECNGVRIPVDTTKPNPNEVEFDNLYLDMNGIIHPCSSCQDDQQRSRRFRASKEGAELTEENSHQRGDHQRGGYLPPRRLREGTEFMDNLAQCLRYYVADRLSNDPGWRNVTVFLSDASVPGEVEHKIMDFIRRQRAQPHHDPTHTTVCVELTPNFTIIREEFKPNKPRPCALCGQMGHEIKDCQGTAREKRDREGAIDRLVNIYKDVVHKTGGYLTQNGYVNLERVEMIMQAVGVAEDNIFKNAKKTIFKRRMKEKRKRMKAEQQGPAYLTTGQFAPQALGRRDRPEPVHNARHQAYDMRMQGVKRKAEDSDSEPEPEDNVRLWEEGWKQRYYKTKFDVDVTDETSGRRWCSRMAVPPGSGTSPFTTLRSPPTSKTSKGVHTDFEKGTKPFKPLEQLMGVFPAASGNFLPETWRNLMFLPSSTSYPDDFAIDLNGRSVALLPFVDERRLRRLWLTSTPTSHLRKRNSLGVTCCSSVISPTLRLHPELYRTECSRALRSRRAVPWNPRYINLDDDPILPDKVVTSPIPMLRDISQNNSVGVKFKDPEYADGFDSNKVLKPDDWVKSRNRGDHNWASTPTGSRLTWTSRASGLWGAHSLNRNQHGGGQYSNTPPPSSYQQGNYRPPHSRPPAFPT
ncbi:hypothetical protein INR49_021876 [Caranx melampygus]|nr:hypothetical protein INR49_021876 [Caranx melampygus]